MVAPSTNELTTPGRKFHNPTNFSSLATPPITTVKTAGRISALARGHEQTADDGSAERGALFAALSQTQGHRNHARDHLATGH